MKKLTRAEVLRWLQGRHWLRVHMFFIITATFLAGLATTKLLMSFGVDVLWLRYAIAVGAAYLVFLAMIRLWISYVCGDNLGTDVIDGAFDFFGRSSDRVDWVETIGDGGAFGGGGASGSWEASADIVSAPLANASTGRGGGGGHGLSFDFDGDEGCIVAILLAALVAILFAGGYLIYTAPAILGEAAFEALLAAALARRAKKLASAGWVGSVVRSTILIFTVVLAMSILLGWYAQKSCPEARRIRDAINCGAAARESLPD
jgi:hypothetical protein